MSKFDKSLILPWSDKLISEEPYEYPFLAKYKSGLNKLQYVATLHSNEEGSETFKLIESILNEGKVDLVIVEGIPNHLGENPKSIQNWACSQGQDKNYEGFETAFTIKQASSKQITFVGGEPNEADVINSLKKNGFSDLDYLFYTYTQQIFQMKEGNLLENKSIEEIFANHHENRSSFLNVEDTLTIGTYIDWYKNNNLSNFSVDALISEVCAPYVNGQLLTQRISSAMCIFRDQYCVSVIKESFNNYHNILIVYGGSHWSTQKEVLHNYLGNPSFSKYSK